MDSRIKKYRIVQAEIDRLTTILVTQHWMPLEQARQEAIELEARTRRECARLQMDSDWYLWFHDINAFPQEQHEIFRPALMGF